MGTSLAIIESEFKPRLPVFADVLRPYHMPPEAIRGALIAACEQNPALLDCSPQTLINGAMSLAVLGLRVDGVTGQGFLLPFSGRATPIIGVKGYTVIAARAGYTLEARLVREGDQLRELGAPEPRIEHEMRPGNRAKVIGAYALARSRTMPTLFSPFLSIDDLLQARDQSKGYQSAMRRGKDHPWKSHPEAMFLKTAKRLLAKDIPNDALQRAAWLDMQHDMGNLAQLRPDAAGVIEGEVAEIYPDRQPQADEIPVLPQRFEWQRPDGSYLSWPTIQDWSAALLRNIEATNNVEQLRAARARNGALMAELAASGFSEQVMLVQAAFDKRGASMS